MGGGGSGWVSFIHRILLLASIMISGEEAFSFSFRRAERQCRWAPRKVPRYCTYVGKKSLTCPALTASLLVATYSVDERWTVLRCEVDLAAPICVPTRSRSSIY